MRGLLIRALIKNAFRFLTSEFSIRWGSMTLPPKRERLKSFSELIDIKSTSSIQRHIITVSVAVFVIPMLACLFSWITKL